MQALFRAEAVRAQQSRFLGTVQLARAPALAWLVLFFACAALALVGFLSFGHYARKTTLHGVLAADGTAVLFAPAQVIAQLRPGQSATLGFEACAPASCPPRAATVVDVERVPLAGAERQALGESAAGAALYRVRAVPQPLAAAPATAAPVAGMRLQARITLERRRMIDWLFGRRGPEP